LRILSVLRGGITCKSLSTGASMSTLPADD
jgi:hypothetical protein